MLLSTKNTFELSRERQYNLYNTLYLPYTIPCTQNGRIDGKNNTVNNEIDCITD